MTSTIADCLTRTGYSSGVPATPVTTLPGTDVWAGGFGELVLTDGKAIGLTFLDDNAGKRRMIGFYAYAGYIYAFIYKHPDDPARKLPGDPPGTWHGDGLLRIEDHGL